MKIKRPSGFLVKMILLCMVLGVVPILILGFYSYYKEYDAVQDKLNKGNMQIVAQVQSSVDNMLKIIDYTTTSYVRSPSIREAMGLTYNAADFQAFNELKQDLTGIHGGTLAIQDVTLVNITNDWLINRTGVTRLSKFHKKDSIISYMNTQKFSIWVGDSGDKGEVSIEDELNAASWSSFATKGVSLVKKLPYMALSQTGLLIIKIPAFELNRLISREDGAGDIIITDEYYRIMIHRDEEMIGKDISAASHIVKITELANQNGQFDMVVDGKMSLVTFRKSDFTGWTYLSVTPSVQMTKQAKSVGWITFSICFAILLLVGLISLQGSKWMYMPIRKVYETLMVNTGTDEPNQRKNELQYIIENVQSMLKTHKQMSSQLQGQVQQLKELFVMKLLQGGLKGKEIQERMDILGYNTAWRWKCVIAVQIDTLEETEYKERDYDLLLFAINNIICELIPGDLCLAPILFEKYQVTLIRSNHSAVEGFKSYISSQAEMIQKNIQKYLNIKVSIGISRAYEKMEHSHTAYKESIEALKYRVCLGQEALLFIEDVQPDHSPQFTYPVQVKAELIDAVKMADAQKVNELLNKYIMEIFKEKLSFQDYQIALTRLLADIAGIVQDLGESFETLYKGENVFKQFFELKTKKDIENWFRYFIIDPIITLQKEKRGLQYKRIANEVLRILNNEYYRDITVEECADRIGFHQSYIRKVFFKETGISFSDYLSQYRMNMAKKWLAETDMKISDIAEKIRYNNPQNFIRYFKKMEGITPGQYREQYRIEK